MIDGPDSLLPIVTFDGETNWDSLLSMAQPHLDANGLSRLSGGLDGKVRSVAVERHYIDRDYRDTFSQFYSKRFSIPQSRCIRLHSLQCPY